jgi:transposase
MARQRRSFTREFKLEAVRLVTEGKRAVSEVARELEIRPELLRGWRKQLTAEGEVAPRSMSVEEENRRLRLELEVARQERDFAKKAAAFFVKDHRGGTR